MSAQEKNNYLRIAFIGLRGIPARWGGIEAFVEETASRMAQKGHKISVYSRDNKEFNALKEINIIHTPTIKINRISSIVHGLTSFFHAIFKNYDLIHLHGYMSYFSIPLLKLFGKKVIITLHGAAWENVSYNKLSQNIIKLATYIGIKFSDRVTTVSLPLKEEIEKLYGVEVILIPPGTGLKEAISPAEILTRFNLETHKYILFLGRLEKVKRVDWIIKAFKSIDFPGNLVIAGDSQDHNYKDSLYSSSREDKRVIFTGFAEGKLKKELLSNCLFFILPSYVEGMPVSLLEAMSYGKVCLVSDIPVHKWIIEDSQTGFLFNSNSFEELVTKMKNIISLPSETLTKIGAHAKIFVQDKFNRDAATELLEDLYFRVVGEKR